MNFVDLTANLMEKEVTLGLYSYFDAKFVSANDVELEQIKRIGYYIKFPLTGSYVFK
jgi:hypothetical protein